MTFGSLFAGIGGFDLGFERAGLTCKWQVEIDDYALLVLKKNWPGVDRHTDVRSFPPEPVGNYQVDCICGGFPCQDVSLAKHRAAGLDGHRSGLWLEFERVIRVLRPRYIVVENVPGLFTRGFSRVLRDLASLGFDAEWSVVSACSLGAPHTRKRLFILGYAKEVSPWRLDRQRAAWRGVQVAGSRPCAPGTHWAREPSVARVAYGVPRGVVRCGAGGNAVVPQVAELIGQRIMSNNKCHITQKRNEQ